MAKKKKKQPEWVGKLRRRLNKSGACKEGIDSGLEWAKQFRTFKAAWEALENTDYLYAIITLVDPEACMYESANDKKAKTFNRNHRLGTDSGKCYCRAFRKTWPGVPPVFKKRRKR